MAAPGGPQIIGMSHSSFTMSDHPHHHQTITNLTQLPPHLIRHVTLLGHHDSGVSTLTRTLVDNARAKSAQLMKAIQQQNEANMRVGPAPSALNASPVVALFHEMKDDQRLAVEEVEEHKRRRNQQLAQVQSSNATQPNETNTTETSATVVASDGNTTTMYGSGQEGLSTLASAAAEGQAAATPTSTSASAAAATAGVHGAIMDHALAAAHSETYMINLLSPQTIERREDRSDSSWSIRISDGCIICADFVKGDMPLVHLQQSDLESALSERVRPALLLNKFDRAFFREVPLTGEQFYQASMRIIHALNLRISTRVDVEFGDVQMSPEYGNVVMGSALHGFGFSLRTFASLYSTKFGVSISKMMNRLWGESYFSSVTKKWTNQSSVPDGADRGFTLFVYKPIESLTRAAISNNRDLLMPMLVQLKVNLSENEMQLQGESLLIAILRTWLPLTSNLLEMVCHQLPSPIEAQSYRVKNLYTGPQNDAAAHAIRTCDPQGPLCMHVCRLIPIRGKKDRFYCFGRIFSGTLRPDQSLRIQRSEYVVGKKDDVQEKAPPTSLLSLSVIDPPSSKDDEDAFRAFAIDVQQGTAGNVIAIVNFDTSIMQTATITDSAQTANIISHRISCSPLIHVSVSPIAPQHLPQLMVALKLLSKSDGLIQCSTTESGEHVMSGVDEGHLKRCIQQLSEEYLPGIRLDFSAFRQSLRESILSLTPQSCLSKTPNKHSRIWTTVQPLDEECAQAIERGVVRQEQDCKERSRFLLDQWPNDWKDQDEARRIWSFGPDNNSPNLLVDLTLGVRQDHLAQSRDSLIAAFRMATRSGCLMEEPMRCVRVNLVDVSYFADAIHWGPGQFIPATRRSIFASQLSSQPCILQPIHACYITVPKQQLANLSKALEERHAVIEAQEEFPSAVDENRPLRLKAYVPVLESFGLPALMLQRTGGTAFCDPPIGFSHWAPIEGDVLEKGSVPHQLVMQARERKGLKLELPPLSEYLDKL